MDEVEWFDTSSLVAIAVRAWRCKRRCKIPLSAIDLATAGGKHRVIAKMKCGEYKADVFRCVIQVELENGRLKEVDIDIEQEVYDRLVHT